jgi:hypothetical protein
MNESIVRWPYLEHRVYSSWQARWSAVTSLHVQCNVYTLSSLFVFGLLTFGSQAFQLHRHLYTLYFFSLFWGHVFFAFHNLGTFCRGELLKLVWISVVKIWSRSLILLFCTYGISGINLCNLGAELSILRCRKRFRGSISIARKKTHNIFLFFLLLIWGHFLVLIWGHPVFLTPYNGVKHM